MTETEALERRIDELCAENERLRAAQAHWELGNCPNCPNVVSLQEALEQNAKLREYAAKAWSLFIRHGAVHACDLSEVDAVRDGLRNLGIEVPS